MVPARMVERVDIVTSGASAVYGSDAVAGVVNFITKKDFEGLVRLSVQRELQRELKWLHAESAGRCGLL